MRSGIIQEIQIDFNDLALEAHNSKGTGFTGQISGLFASSQHKDVKAAAEAAQLTLRGLEHAQDPQLACREHPVGFFLATESQQC